SAFLLVCGKMKTNPWQISEGGTIARLYNYDLTKIKIPVPPIEEQKRIVSILDKFDALCNDLTSGIPAEINARQKQYEYYRDKLLNFKEKQ
ncbi:MAG: restriction endonuclease subunit S, partial [Muribaculaceae bacterium]|nr:restriction endonuclease subunit S [Muribaculaceae bacterium]